MGKFTQFVPLATADALKNVELLCQQEITDLELTAIEQGQYITEIELMILEAANV